MAKWQGYYKLRKDGPEEHFVAVSLGKIGKKLEGVKAGQTAVVTLTDENTIEIEIMDADTTNESAD